MRNFVIYIKILSKKNTLPQEIDMIVGMHLSKQEKKNQKKYNNMLEDQNESNKQNIILDVKESNKSTTPNIIIENNKDNEDNEEEQEEEEKKLDKSEKEKIKIRWKNFFENKRFK